MANRAASGRLIGKPDNWSWEGEQLSDSAALNFSGEGSLASSKVGAFPVAVSPLLASNHWSLVAP
jgi:hypothetical protein